ncbi:rh blood group, D antigen isoform 2-T2 [Aulostomus maculatus]
MAPQYAPSLRSRLAPLLLFLQIGFIVVCSFFVEISNSTFSELTFYKIYAGTFLARYGFSALGFNLLVAVIAIQWAIILRGLEAWYHSGKIVIDMRSLVDAEICAASAIISIGAVLGKTNPVQLVIITLLEVPGFLFNDWLLLTLLSEPPHGSFRFLHIFGAFFGLMMSSIMSREGSEQGFEKEKFDRTPGLFSMLGSVFLWMFWPSFNSSLVNPMDPEKRLMAMCNTYLALAVSAVTAFAVSVLSSSKGKLNLVHLQSSILAGGVAVGVSPPSFQPWEAMTVGFIAAVVSTVGFRYLKVHMLVAFQCHDTCAVLSTHGLPGLLGWLAHLLLQIRALDDHTMAIRFAVFDISLLFITLSVSLTMGTITGLLLKWNLWRPPQDKKCFDDQAYWEFPHLAVPK